MAKGRASSTSQNSASASASATTAKTTDGRMVLRVRTSQQMKNPAGNKSKMTPKKKKKSSKIDAFKPKKPPTAFFYFLEDFRKEFQEKNPDIKTMRDIGKACGERWKTMTYEEKVQYYDIATEKRAEFDRAMAEYMKRKERGEYQDYEDDSDFDN
ncbi:unnamed protein product [Coffea canephora]|uniref:HMG box domain-containing protein n=1 Tax=Coffea canephora TaxID=49390 RepID=A0A068UDS0_COFCA|nr:high mobility group B protein 14-like isoform X1 [Coffea arabica]CDP06349.1 unnamed protein product [Coffea canephora]